MLRLRYLGGALLFFFGLLFLFRPTTQLIVSTSYDKTVIDEFSPLCVWTKPHFALSWRHSVEKQIWQEFYRQTPKAELFLSHTYVQSFGAGVPSDGVLMEAPEGYMGQKVALSLPALSWVVSENMQGVIFYPTADDRQRTDELLLTTYEAKKDHLNHQITEVKTIKNLGKQRVFELPLYQMVANHTTVHIVADTQPWLWWRFMEECHDGHQQGQ